MQDKDAFSGMWYCAYWFPSNNHLGEDVSEYYARVHQKGSKLVIESLPNKIDAYLIVRLQVDGNLATGTWEERTSPQGEFKGMVYSGAMQLLIDKDRHNMEGKWVGVGQEAGTPQIYSGRWMLRRLGSHEVSAQVQKDHVVSTHA